MPVLLPSHAAAARVRVAAALPPHAANTTTGAASLCHTRHCATADSFWVLCFGQGASMLKLLVSDEQGLEVDLRWV